MVVSETQEPAPNAFADTWERGLDPWHADAFPSEFKAVGTTGPRAAGWYAIDWCGNVVSFVPDGTPLEKGNKNVTEGSRTFPYPGTVTGKGF